ncbi:MAG: mechanosensitive ion channel family protein [Acidimicrobiia bacterium]|nr:mechanosensitive ion channel family protein [Acidimicrobiia bacterium]
MELFGIDLSERLGRWLVTVLVVVGLALVRWLVVKIIQRRVDDQTIRYRSRKTSNYVFAVLVIALIVRVWFPEGNLGTYLGLVSAGIAIALADVLKNLVGWAFILLRRPFSLGDRVEIAGHSGDVIDVSVFRFTVLEIGNWVAADQSTGRILHIPNGLLFTHSLANYTEGFEYLWHEMPVLVTFESDWEEAERMMQEVLSEHSPETMSGEVARDLRMAALRYDIKYTHLTPTTYIAVRDSGVEITGRLLVPARSRRSVEQAIWRSMLKLIAASPTVELAYPTRRTVFSGPEEPVDGD